MRVWRRPKLYRQGERFREELRAHVLPPPKSPPARPVDLTRGIATDPTGDPVVCLARLTIDNQTVGVRHATGVVFPGFWPRIFHASWPQEYRGSRSRVPRCTATDRMRKAGAAGAGTLPSSVIRTEPCSVEDHIVGVRFADFLAMRGVADGVVAAGWRAW